MGAYGLKYNFYFEKITDLFFSFSNIVFFDSDPTPKYENKTTLHRKPRRIEWEPPVGPEISLKSDFPATDVDAPDPRPGWRH